MVGNIILEGPLITCVSTSAAKASDADGQLKAVLYYVSKIHLFQNCFKLLWLKKLCGFSYYVRINKMLML